MKICRPIGLNMSFLFVLLASSSKFLSFTVIWISTKSQSWMTWRFFSGIKLSCSNFSCFTATALPTVKSKFLNCPVESCPFCETRWKPDEYHLVLQCKSFDDKRKEFLPKYYYNYPNVIKYDQLMNVTDKNLLKNLAKFLHSIITRCSSTDINL